MSKPFPWPNGARCALSLSFDDARLSQIDTGIPILNRHGIRGTFYVSPHTVELRLAGWRHAVADGHEIGNHTVTHPCSENFAFVRENGNPVEDYTLERMDAELRDANAWIAATLGVTPTTFAYPCGEMAVGRGAATQSYVPLVARRFIAGRAFNQDAGNCPGTCDLARLWCVSADCVTLATLRAVLDAAQEQGAWLILGAHEIGEKGQLTMSAAALEALCKDVSQPGRAVWVDTVAAVAAHVAAQR